jgi:hypothetical protein
MQRKIICSKIAVFAFVYHIQNVANVNLPKYHCHEFTLGLPLFPHCKPKPLMHRHKSTQFCNEPSTYSCLLQGDGAVGAFSAAAAENVLFVHLTSAVADMTD